MSKQIVAAFAIFLGASATTTAQAATAQASCALPAIAASAELQTISASNLMTVPVAVNGKPKQFLLDIGTSAMQISQAAVKELGLTQPMKHNSSVATAQMNGSESSAAVGGQNFQFAVVDVNSAHAQEDSLPLVGVGSFTIGQATGHNMVFAVADSSKLGAAQPYDGLMTGSFFRQYDVDLDFSGKKISYLTPTTCTDLQQVVFWPHAQVAAVPMVMSGGRITLQVTMRGRPINAVIDTSAEHTIVRRDIAERILGLKADTPDMMPADDLHDGLGVRVYRHVLPLVSFADGIAAHDVPVLIQTNAMTYNRHREPTLGSRATFRQDTLIPDLTLGMDVLRQLHLYVVYGQNSIYVTSAE
jgi:predicted aspartyl protease